MFTKILGVFLLRRANPMFTKILGVISSEGPISLRVCFENLWSCMCKTLVFKWPPFMLMGLPMMQKLTATSKHGLHDQLIQGGVTYIQNVEYDACS